jgi:hypothetical protein
VAGAGFVFLRLKLFNMKAGIFIIILLATTVAARSQSLKDLLYSGKLKNDSGSVVRKGEDLSSKIDTSTKKPAPVETAKTSSTQPMTLAVDSAGNTVVVAETAKPATATTTTAAGTDATETAGDPNTPKDNNAVWKSYIDELTGALRTEVMTNKKIKNGTYSVLIDYNIEVDGNITVNSVSSSPGNDYLEDQIKQRLTLTAPQLTPLLSANGKPRKAAKKQTITLAK